MATHALTIRQAADRLGVTYRYARFLIQTGELKAHVIGYDALNRPRWYITPQAVAALMRRRRLKKATARRPGTFPRPPLPDSDAAAPPCGVKESHASNVLDPPADGAVGLPIRERRRA